MKKILKVLSAASLAAVLTVSTGCSCKIRTKVVDEVTAGLNNSELVSSTDEEIDFVAVYVETGEDSKKVTTVRRDFEHDIFVLEYVHTSTSTGNEVKLKDEKYMLYKKENKVYRKNLKVEGEEVVETVVNYSTPYQAYKNFTSTHEYHKLINGTYDEYKTVPFNACASDGNKDNVSGIYSPSNELTECSAKKELFKKEYTFEIGYNTSVIEWNDVKMTVNENNMITSLEVIKSVSDNSNAGSFTLTIDYSNIDLTK